MTQATYKESYEAAKRDLMVLVQKRDLLDREIDKLKKTLKALGEQCGIDPAEIDRLLLFEGFAANTNIGFTDAIRRLFRIHKATLSPKQIRDDLLKIGMGQGQVNLLSSVHTVLRRMAENGELELDRRSPSRGYKLKPERE